MAGPSNALLMQIAQGGQPRMADAFARGAQQGNALLQYQQEQQRHNALADIAQAYAQGGPQAAAARAGQLGRLPEAAAFDNTVYGRGRDQSNDQFRNEGRTYSRERDQVGDKRWDLEFGATQDWRKYQRDQQNRPSYSMVTGPDGKQYAIDPRNPTGGFMPIPNQPEDPFLSAISGQSNQYGQAATTTGKPRTVGNIPPDVRQRARSLAEMGDKAGAKEVISDWIKGGIPETPDFKEISVVRKEFTQLPSYKTYAASVPLYNSMVEASKFDNKASDLQLVYGMGKIFDPTSVVQQGEMIMVTNTASLPQNLIGMINSVNGGARLTPTLRAQLIEQARVRTEAYGQSFESDKQRFTDFASRHNVNPQDIIADTPSLKNPSAPPTPGTVQGGYIFMGGDPANENAWKKQP